MHQITDFLLIFQFQGLQNRNILILKRTYNYKDYQRFLLLQRLNQKKHLTQIFLQYKQPHLQILLRFSIPYMHQNVSKITKLNIDEIIKKQVYLSLFLNLPKFLNSFGNDKFIKNQKPQAQIHKQNQNNDKEQLGQYAEQKLCQQEFNLQKYPNKVQLVPNQCNRNVKYQQDITCLQFSSQKSCLIMFYMIFIFNNDYQCLMKITNTKKDLNLSSEQKSQTQKQNINKWKGQLNLLRNITQRHCGYLLCAVNPKTHIQNNQIKSLLQSCDTNFSPISMNEELTNSVISFVLEELENKKHVQNELISCDSKSREYQPRQELQNILTLIQYHIDNHYMNPQVNGQLKSVQMEKGSFKKLQNKLNCDFNMYEFRIPSLTEQIILILTKKQSRSLQNNSNIELKIRQKQENEQNSIKSTYKNSLQNTQESHQHLNIQSLQQYLSRLQRIQDLKLLNSETCFIFIFKDHIILDQFIEQIQQIEDKRLKQIQTKIKSHKKLIQAQQGMFNNKNAINYNRDKEGTIKFGQNQLGFNNKILENQIYNLELHQKKILTSFGFNSFFQFLFNLFKFLIVIVFLMIIILCVSSYLSSTYNQYLNKQQQTNEIVYFLKFFLQILAEITQQCIQESKSIIKKYVLQGLFNYQSLYQFVLSIV